MLPGAIGVRRGETLKLLLGVGAADRRLLLFDALALTFPQ